MENVSESYLADYLKIIEQNVPHAPIGNLLGIRIVDADIGRVVAEMNAQESLLNSLGMIQGGAISVLADTVMGLACGTKVNKAKKFSTLEFKINFLKPVNSGTLVAIGKVQHFGHLSCVTEAEIFNEDKQLVAKSTGTLLIQ
jgi:uncharacterized protein (TIGR00369 family)